ncbi:MAG: hypothetical protein WCT28_01380 [Patescibacteria group bacterium]|jgi:hypothetical protein
MLNKQDITTLRGMFEDVLGVSLRKEVPAIVLAIIQNTVPRMIHEQLEINNHILKREIRDEVHSLIKASEAGLIRRMETLEEKLTKRMDEGFSSILELIDEGLIPQIQEHERDIQLIKRELKLA